jgi:hypothetical protein
MRTAVTCCCANVHQSRSTLQAITKPTDVYTVERLRRSSYTVHAAELVIVQVKLGSVRQYAWCLMLSTASHYTAEHAS